VQESTITMREHQKSSNVFWHQFRYFIGVSIFLFLFENFDSFRQTRNLSYRWQTRATSCL